MARALRLAGLALGALALTVAAAPPAAAHDLRTEEGRAEARRMLADYTPSWAAASRLRGAAVPCTDGKAAGYACRNVDLLSVLPLTDMGGGSSSSSMWHWADAGTGREYILFCRSNGVAFIDVTDPLNPVYVGNLPSHEGTQSSWRDVRVYKDTAYVGADGIKTHGLQVFDLKRLRGLTAPQTFAPDHHYAEIGNIHTISIDADAGVLHAVGSNTCGSGNHMISLAEPLRPVNLGCYSGDGYVHENIPEKYAGPDSEHAGKHISFNYSVKNFTIIDVTDPKSPKLIGKGTYPGASYIHQGDRTRDWKYVVQNDELITTAPGSPSFVWDISDLDNPKLVKTDRTGDLQAIRHNEYNVGTMMYQATYKAGLRIHDASKLPDSYAELGYFDVYPADDSSGFAGTWQINPFLRNGTVAVSSMAGGLFLVRPTGAARNPAQFAANAQFAEKK
ncbi:hypothetical protein GCM10010123_10650 [Pilimelia anulata]|uniref:Choice-of-anchor B family protein n=1 Tax=Pilimelia anulata TaxID=53371 RepID=A0A8J3B312_9ACTN|nr:choice-of-anchor B family protein [Pilimelia anulata]GGJ82881.1 hypothetical protein GCM10010123_10650 [Pilimelia anulata]